VFHMMSIMERKNPLGLIRAFARSFRRNEPVVLVLKTVFGNKHPTQIAELRRAAAEAEAEIVAAHANRKPAVVREHLDPPGARIHGDHLVSFEHTMSPNNRPFSVTL